MLSLIVGLVCGIVISFIMDAINRHDKQIWLNIVLYCLAYIILLYSFKTSIIKVSVGYGVAGGIMSLVLYEHNRSQRKKSVSRQKSPYINHCWACKAPIDSLKDQLCPQCKKHYICSQCGKCWCDNPQKDYAFHYHKKS